MMLIFIVITSVGGSDDIKENEVPIEGWDKDWVFIPFKFSMSVRRVVSLFM